MNELVTLRKALGQDLGWIECQACGEKVWCGDQGTVTGYQSSVLHMCVGHPTVATIRRLIQEELERVLSKRQ